MVPLCLLCLLVLCRILCNLGHRGTPLALDPLMQAPAQQMGLATLLTRPFMHAHTRCNILFDVQCCGAHKDAHHPDRWMCVLWRLDGELLWGVCRSLKWWHGLPQPSWNNTMSTSVLNQSRCKLPTCVYGGPMCLGLSAAAALLASQSGAPSKGCALCPY